VADRSVRSRIHALLAATLFSGILSGSARGQDSHSYTPTDGYARLTGVDVLHYDIGVSIPDSGTVIEGRTGILFEIREPALRELPLDFGELTVDSVRVGGVRARFRHERERLTVTLPASSAGARAEAVVWYHGSPSDGLFIQPNIHGQRTVFADNWPDRAHHWFPGIDHPSDKATADFVVDAPASMEVVANGAQRAIDEIGNGRRRTRWSEAEELPMYNMVIGVADFVVQRSGTPRGVEVSNWVFPEDSAAAARGFARSPEIVAFFDSLFGPFPFEKLANVQSSTRFGGMENSSAIFYDEKRVAGRGAPASGSTTVAPADTGAVGQASPAEASDLTDLASHETAHQWFGDAVTEADWHHLWLSEGFATYCAALFAEFHGGPQGKGPVELRRQMRDMAAQVLAYEPERSRPIVDPGEKDLFALLNPDNYEKGAWVLHMLRHEIGDAAFFEGLRDYYAEFNGGTAWTADFERVMEEAAGRDLGWFFRQWLDRPGHPVLRVQREEAGAGRTRVLVEQVQPGSAYRFGLDLELSWAGGSRRERVDVREAQTVVTFDSPAPIDSVLLDPDVWLLYEAAP
jgi:aminopeptidase N